ncbi:MAG: hypothetical protein RLZZ495_1227 [Pseudomonadota bacterium]|jgi:type IV pilus assembly protein PilP
MKRQAWLFAGCATLVIMGCTTTSEDEIKKWMTDQRSNIKPKVTPIPPPKQFKPETYGNADKPDPFSSQKLTQALRNEVAQTNAQNNSALVEPELARRKEPLEAVPLDTMTLLGNITQAGRLVALIKVDSLLYQIKLGAYLGQNYGKVIKITETEVTLREIVQDAAGTWVERMQTLTLQERGK